MVRSAHLGGKMNCPASFRLKLEIKYLHAFDENVYKKRWIGLMAYPPFLILIKWVVDYLTISNNSTSKTRVEKGLIFDWLREP